MNPFVDDITRRLAPATGLDPEQIGKLLETPRDLALGDYAFPCFLLAKDRKQPPPVCAKALAEALQPSELVPRHAATGPYLNFSVDRARHATMVLSDVFERGKRFGDSDEGRGKTIVIDFSSPNIAKPFSIAHLRSTVIGHSIHRIHQALGWTCVGINHLGDWGTQFGNMMVAFKRWGDEGGLDVDPVKKLLALYVRFHEEAETDKALEEEGRAWFKKLEDGDPEAKRLWTMLKDLSLKEFQHIYDRLGITFDHYTGEAFYNTRLADTIKEVEAKGLAKVSESALIVDLEEFDMPPALLRKSDGATLYMTRDLCALTYRAAEFGFDSAAYVVGSDQKLHFKQLFKVAELMGYPWAGSLHHVNFGLYRFPEGKMSTRKGRVIFLEEVLDEAVAKVRETIREKNPDLPDIERTARQIGIGAVIFNDLKNGRTKDVVFDWAQLLAFDGKTGPYLQYTHARISSILRKHGEAPANGSAAFELLTEPEEAELVRRIESFPAALKSAAADFEPSRVATCLLDLAEVFNSYYNRGTHDPSVRVLTDDPRVRNARMVLISAVRMVLEKGLFLLGIEAPEEM